MSAASRAEFDRLLGQLPTLPNATSVRPATIQSAGMFGIGAAVTCIVRTVRIEGRDTIFLQHMLGDDYTALVLPPEVCDCIARQRDALGTMNRRKAGRARAEADKAAGVVPGFARTPNSKRRSK